MADLNKIEDKLDTVEDLLQAAFLASRGLGDDMNAVASLIAVIQKELTLARVAIRGEIGAEAAQPEARQRDVLSFSVGKDSRRPVRLLQKWTALNRQPASTAAERRMIWNGKADRQHSHP